MKVVQALKDSDVFLKRLTTKTIQNETKEQKGEFSGVLFGTLGASLLGNMLISKAVLRAGYGSSIKEKLIPTHYLTNFEIQRVLSNEPRFNIVCSRNNLSKRI